MLFTSQVCVHLVVFKVSLHDLFTSQVCVHLVVFKVSLHDVVYQSGLCTSGSLQGVIA